MYKDKEVVLGGLQSKAIARFGRVMEYIKECKIIEARVLFADMFLELGCSEPTLGRYLKVAQIRGLIKINGQEISWNSNE